jgi:flagellar hook protein FlgE
MKRLQRSMAGLLLIFLLENVSPPSALAGFTNITTGVNSDLSINGSGYFIVMDPVTGISNATRFGDFFVNENGYIDSTFGSRLQGYNSPSLNTIGDLKLDTTYAAPGAFIESFEIETNGLIKLFYNDATSGIVGQVLLQQFLNPTALIKVSKRQFAWTSNAVPLASPTPPGTAGTGLINSGSVELLVPELQISPYAGPPTNFAQGMLFPTGIALDLGIEGSGFFVLRRTNDNALFATRAGVFYLESDYIVHYSGMRLQGYNEGSLSTIGDVRVSVDGTYNPNRTIEYSDIDRYGNIWVSLDDYEEVIVGQVLLAGCSNINAVVRTNFDLFPINTNGDLWTPLQQSYFGSLGWIVPGYVELSQFDTNLLMVRSNLNFFYQGQIESTGIPDNLAIVGNGFFSVRDPVLNQVYATRLGRFQLDSNGYLVDSAGDRVQGLNDTNLTNYGDIKIDADDSTAQVVSNEVLRDGTISASLSDGTRLVRGQVLLQLYKNLQSLKPAGNLLYSNLTAAMPMFTNGAAGYVSPGQIIGGALELPVNFAPLQLLPKSGLRILITDLETYPYAEVQSSSDLIHWQVIGHVNNSDLDAAEFFVTPQATPQFYRVNARLQ